MQPGLFYTDKLKPKLEALDQEAKTAEKATKAFSREVFRPIACEQMGVPAIAFCNSYDKDNLDFTINSAPGITIKVDTDKVGGAMGAYIKTADAARALSKSMCKKRCAISDLLDNSYIRSFSARVRAIYGNRKDFTVVQLSEAYRDFMEINAPHSCPV